MIRIRVTRRNGHIAHICADGHAGCAPKGEDIICAAVSALVQTFLFSLQRLLGLDVEADIGDGHFSLSIPADLAPALQEQVTLLGESMLVGLDEIKRSYPGFLHVSEE
ncbi:MAG: ribosomal-processing cysteine protease Prp [Firmicutes bacterium]|nr:ribosomal-processing cysteine protease Prp [Bacillota bacterium]